MGSGSTTNSSRSKTSKSDDEIGWKYNKLQDPNNSSQVVCNFCNKVTTGGVTRAKRHQIRIKGDVAPCPKCPPPVREELWANLQQKTTTKKLEHEMFMSSCGTVDLEEEDEEEELMPRESTLFIGGKLLEENRKHIFWTPCAAHCIDLILENIGKISKVKKTIQRAMSFIGFIYNHSSTLNLMRRFTNKTELVRYGVTRFAMNFLLLQSVYKQKANLQKMFTSNEWTSSKLARDAKGVKVVSTVMAASYWNNVLYTLRVIGLLVTVLWLVDSESKPAMPYIYEAMTKAKDAIKRLQHDDESKYKEIFEIIDNRWECQLYQPLHAVAHYLNLAIFYSTPNMDLDLKLTGGLMDCIKKMEPDIHSKKRNQPDHQKMHDLVFVKYNQALKARYDTRDEIDPIVLNEIDFDNEWLVGESGEVEDAHNDLVFENDNLTWGDVERALGAREIRTYTKGQAKRNTATAFTSQIPTLTFKTPATSSSVDAIYATRISEEAYTLLNLEKSEEEEDEFEPDGTS
ncbi:hypothetical protein SLEP1_g24823 [Rubroshorea leprosula]|uniref:DUF659 domain-containing protein n=1 Tax=Rubroshorea leprosula TaxID=152421 RepID=A0AAV5JSD9_9ROSI|nr:hypothetical protein SLEP1_g24823 [Rubroshorea leprosula]